MLVENTAGAAGTIGTAKVAASPPDGYSLLVMHFGHAANTALYPNLRYDAITDFEPIGMIAESPMAFVAKKAFPADNFKDFVAHVKAGKEKITQRACRHRVGLAAVRSVVLERDRHDASPPSRTEARGRRSTT